MRDHSRRLFGEMLVTDGIVTAAQLAEAVAEQERERAAGGEVSRLGVILGRLGYLDKQTLERYIERVMQDYF